MSDFWCGSATSDAAAAETRLVLMDRDRPVQSASWVLVVVLLPLLATRAHATEKCLPGMDTPGITSPGGDIVLEAGNPLKINCTIFSNHWSAEGKNASDLMFYEGNKRVPDEFINIVNTTTIQLTVENLPMDTYVYYCRLGDQVTAKNQTPVCLNKVKVGKKPEEVQNFNCVSYNWQRLVCRWSVQPNPVPTKYKIYFNLFGRAGRM
ncbi:hypothetical protein B566_EDAN009717 [Ephemera danica]|nr:hypothetical protein B566_EDAN009717 [Ephemera danica]